MTLASTGSRSPIRGFWCRMSKVFPLRVSAMNDEDFAIIAYYFSVILGVEFFMKSGTFRTIKFLEKNKKNVAKVNKITKKIMQLLYRFSELSLV
jgi:hypothetical protein